MYNIFDHDSDADIFGSSNSFKGMAVSLLLTDDEINALVNGRFVSRQVEGYGLTIGNKDSFEREFEERIKKINEEWENEE